MHSICRYQEHHYTLEYNSDSRLTDVLLKILYQSRAFQDTQRKHCAFRQTVIARRMPLWDSAEDKDANRDLKSKQSISDSGSTCDIKARDASIFLQKPT